MLDTPNTTSEAALAHARELLARVPLVDGHNDLPYVLRYARNGGGDLDKARLDQDLNGRDTDIPKLRAGALSAQ